MKCPVCKTECGNAIKCPTCGFDQLKVEFINQEEAEEWKKNTLEKYKEKYSVVSNIDDGIFLIENGILKKHKYKISDRSVIIPDGVKIIDEGAVSYHFNIVSVKIPKSVKEIRKHAFNSCSSLLSIDIPNSVEYIGDFAFYDCSQLENVKIPNGVKYIGEAAFMSHFSKQVIELPRTVEHIGDLAFYDYKNIILIVPKNSYAEQYAKENHIKFEYIEE